MGFAATTYCINAWIQCLWGYEIIWLSTFYKFLSRHWFIIFVR